MPLDIISSSRKQWQLRVTSVKLKWKNTSKRNRIWIRRIGYFLLGAGLTVILLPTVAYGFFRYSYVDRVYPGVVVAGVELNQLTQEEGDDLLKREVHKYLEVWPLVLTHEQQSYEVPFESTGVKIDTSKTLNRTLTVGRGETWRENANSQWNAWRYGVSMPLTVSYDEGWLEDFVATVSAEIDVPAVPPEIEILPQADKLLNSRIQVAPGESGIVFDQDAFRTSLTQGIEELESIPTQLPVRHIETLVSEEQKRMAVERAEQLLEKQLVVSFSDNGYDKNWSLLNLNSIIVI